MTLSAIPKAIRTSVFERDAARCRYCGLVQFGQAAVFHVNHIIPKSKGGVTDEANLVLQCPHCSLRKSDKTTAIDPLGDDVVLLFHPLRQRWQEHFRLDDNGVLHGKTPVGRGTIAALHMNDPLTRMARSMQIGLGLIAPSSG